MRAETAGAEETDGEESTAQQAVGEDAVSPIELLPDQNMTLFQRRKI